MTVADEIIREIRAQQGRTELELAELLFGPCKAAQQRINPTCRKLVAKGRLVRTGKGGPSDPFTYHLPRRTNG
ncbi:hypothetical protein UP10_14415 [Bradyrhizobium sp. LTSPM299]|uniref:hypothetical protein n=1 Tax=Bradyrhizobium sp. LTSPM299 TaxID=1619233 RepID=UPI0005C8652D|nr:hypothetical protein [Bradyrhizobium sp. LTSPM299]KJC59888.1 hypothetical protein UP10_14415 [Bradyrhizobium sp. LTSPM299]